MAPTKRCAGGRPRGSPGAPRTPSCDGFESGCIPDAAVAQKVVGATSSAFIAYATPFDLPSFGRGAISERESSERGTISD